MAKGARAYRGEKRKKEISRQKRQEEKRQRRFKKEVSTQQETGEIESKDTGAEQAD